MIKILIILLIKEKKNFMSKKFTVDFDKITTVDKLQAVSPAKDWGPYLAKHRGELYASMDEPYEAVKLAEMRAKDEKGQSNQAFEAVVETETVETKA